jgi:hypothetical protein
MFRVSRIAVVVSLVVAGCSASETVEPGVTSVAQRLLRSVGIHANAGTGLLSVVSHGVTLVDGKFPEVSVGYVFVDSVIPDPLPDTCQAGLLVTDKPAPEGLSVGFEFRSSGGERVKFATYVDWKTATIVVRDCATLDGDHSSVGAIVPGVPLLPGDTTEDTVWDVLPTFAPGVFTGRDKNLGLPLRLVSQVLSSDSGATSAFAVDALAAAPIVDPLADEFEQLTTPLPRITTDRPDDVPNSAQLKFIYVVPSFAKDRVRDTSGEISRFAFQINEWWANQNAGFGLRLDTYKGAIDVGYLPLAVTEEEWRDYFVVREPFNNGLSRFQQVLADSGWGNELVADPSDPLSYADVRRGKLHMLVFEAPGGVYARTGQDRECVSLIDAVNDGVSIIGFAVANSSGGSCGSLDVAGRFPANAAAGLQSTWVRTVFGGIDHVAQWMRGLPGCEFAATPKDGERVKIPGVLDPSRAWEIRGGFMRDLGEVNDPTSDAFISGQSNPFIPALDPRHDLYFHITSDKLATGKPCNSDISRHPLWDDEPFDRDARVSQSRTSYDREDERDGTQLKAVYAVRNGAQDRRYDVTGDIEKSLLQMKSFLEQQTGGTNTLNIDTFNGRPDVMYFPLPRALTPKAGDTCADEPCPNDQTIYAAMKTAGRVDPDKQYVIFYDGGIEFGGKGLCGGSASNTKASFVNLSGITSEMCAFLPFSESKVDSWSVGLLALHEVFHALGAVCENSAVANDGMHSSVANDIMNGSAQGTVALDPRRAYWYDNPSGCPPLSRSALFVKQ